jgi:Methyltransferase domain
MTGRLLARANGFYALNICLPLEAAALSWRRRTRALRGVARRHSQATSLSQVAWSDLFPRRALFLVEIEKRNGNVTVGELAVLAQAAASARPGSEIVEIGTFDGRTTLNLAINAPEVCQVFTLDLPPEHPTQFALDADERPFVDKPFTGARFRSCEPLWPGAARIVQLSGDSASFDWSPHEKRAGLVFVDGSHAYDYVRADSETAFRLAAAGAAVLWHDYGVWEGVTRALEELERASQLGLRHIQGTSLVCWRKPELAQARAPVASR